MFANETGLGVSFRPLCFVGGHPSFCFRVDPTTSLSVVMEAISLPVALIAFVVALLVFVVGGYLVSWTSRRSRRELDDRVGIRLQRRSMSETDGNEGADPADTTSGSGYRIDQCGTPEFDEIDEYLLELGVLTDRGGERLLLGEPFAAVWWRRCRRFREGDRLRDQFAMFLDVDPDRLTYRTSEHFDVLFGDERVGRWSSEAAFLAELAATPTLAEWLPNWGSLDDRERAALLARLRSYLEQCPACDGTLRTVAESPQSSLHPRLPDGSIECASCGAIVFVET